MPGLPPPAAGFGRRPGHHGAVTASESGLGPEAETPDATAETRGPASRPVRKTAADMVRSLAVIIAMVGALVLIVPRPNEVVQPVDVNAAVAGARAGLPFEPSVPSGLPTGWAARTAKFQRGTDDVAMWLLSYSTPSGTFAGVRQGGDPTAAWEDRQVTDGRESGTRRVAGQDWVVRSRLDRGITSWVLRRPGVTTIVTGTANEADLERLAQSLSPPPG